MKISTEIHSASKLVGEEKAVELIAKAGFDAWDFSMFEMCRFDKAIQDFVDNGHPLTGPNYLAFARRLKQIGLDNGITCNQSHAPYPTYRPRIRSFMKRAIECTAEAGGQICVIHPDNFKSAEENAEMFLELLPFAKECGVKIATENMWKWDEEKGHSVFAACATSESFRAHLDAVNDDFLIACLDIGHANLYNNAAAGMIRQLGNEITCLHVHDNDLQADRHILPYMGKTDIDGTFRALHDIGYQGDVTFESEFSIQDLPLPLVPDMLRYFEKVGRHLIRIAQGEI